MADAAIQTSSFSHPGAASSWSSKTFNHDNKALLRDGDFFNCTTHGAGQKITGTASKGRDLDGKTFAKLYDTAACGAQITSGDPTIQWS
jgi:uncharacterized Zn-binding protein involved in type VI secretion